MKDEDRQDGYSTQSLYVLPPSFGRQLPPPSSLFIAVTPTAISGCSDVPAAPIERPCQSQLPRLRAIGFGGYAALGA